MNAKRVIRLCLVLALVVSAVLRPPGTMLVVEGEAFTYELCMGGEVKAVTVYLENDEPEMVDAGCDFYALLFAALPIAAPDVAPTALKTSWTTYTIAPRLHPALVGWPAFSSRAPPFVS